MIEPLVLSLVVWIAARTGLPIPDPPVYATRSTAAGPPPSVRALHFSTLDGESSPIRLPPGWRQDDPVDQSILLHDLVHYMQARSDAHYRCPGEREAQAYRLQIAWLNEHGVDFFEAFDINPRFVFRLQRCPGDLDTARR